MALYFPGGIWGMRGYGYEYALLSKEFRQEICAGKPNKKYDKDNKE